MKNQSLAQQSRIFKRASSTYYYASLFFPRRVKQAVFSLYAYVRTADDFVDSLPPDIKHFEALAKETQQEFAGKPVKNPLVQGLLELARTYTIEEHLITSFLNAMRMDTTKKTYQTYKELEEYMFGSAETVGIIMAKIFQLPEESYPFAHLQGKAMQFMNFIRDIAEDLALGRVYLPQEDLRRFSVSTFPPQTAKEKTAFAKLIRFEIKRYYEIQADAAQGYHFIPPAMRIPVKTAASLYNSTAAVIFKHPLIVFEKKVKPRWWQVFFRVFIIYFTL